MCRMALIVILAGVSGLVVSDALAQPAVNLTGTYRCVRECAPGFEGGTAFVTQHGWDVNVVTESGAAARAWVDWFSPTSRVWIEAFHQGAVYSSDGMRIQFDGGRVWDRMADPEHRAVSYCARRYRSYDPNTQTYRGRYGQRACP